MFKGKVSALLGGLVIALASATAQADSAVVIFETNQGNIELELNAEKAPISVENFLGYVDSGYYNNTIFHRVIAGFMIQGGGFTQAMEKKDTKAPIKNESDNGLKNEPGTIAMARTRAPHSATAQFFINTVNNRNLNGSSQRPGYAVFGKVTKGMDVVMQISRVPTTTVDHYRDVPKSPVIIEKAYRADAE
ncbi:peptidylprolyl isomerase [Marinobacterium jannaschii]|uniref:peptidylprolyl isomerase n=1 Tax=Marinobacterium jannaschii TaxID=64970 RepID=UPI000485A417|nr:peptidylprolyl isomerase [Marinobacterium jannaschii]